MVGVTISNIKLSAKTPKTCLSTVEEFCFQNRIRTRRFQNFLVVHRKFTHVLFKSSRKLSRVQHCNITKVLLNETSEAIDELAFIIQKDPQSIDFKVDNITATGSLDRTIELEDFIQGNSDISSFISYQPEVFPGLFLKNQFGKTIIFKSGKLVIIGCKTTYELEEVLSWVLQRCANI